MIKFPNSTQLDVIVALDEATDVITDALVIGRYLRLPGVDGLATSLDGISATIGKPVPANTQHMPPPRAQPMPPPSPRRQHKPRPAPPDGLRTPAETARSERVMSAEAAAILGIKLRKLQAMSQRGEIPGAAKLGRLWTYNRAKLCCFVEQQEQATTCRNEKPRLGATGAGRFSGAKLRSVGNATGGRLTQMIQQSQKRAAKLAKREQ